MLNFNIDSDKCIRCGLCAKDCVTSIITMNDLPEISPEREENCLKCQHCMAICPTGALSILGVDPKDCTPVREDYIKVDDLAEMIRTRRSIRKFEQKDLDSETLDKLFKTASYAPTGAGNNGVTFHLSRTKEQTDKIKISLYNAIKKANEEGKLADTGLFLVKMQTTYEEHGIDLLFRDAPHFVLTTVPKDNACPKEDGIIALTYFELLANSMGVGTLWNGLSIFALQLDEELQKEMGMGEDLQIGYAMVFGKPAVKYKRSIQKKESHLKTINLK